MHALPSRLLDCARADFPLKNPPMTASCELKCFAFLFKQNQDRKHRTYVYVLTVTEILEDWEDSVNIGELLSLCWHMFSNSPKLMVALWRGKVNMSLRLNDLTLPCCRLRSSKSGRSEGPLCSDRVCFFKLTAVLLLFCRKEERVVQSRRRNQGPAVS